MSIEILKDVPIRPDYSGAVGGLAYLYKRKGDYRKALNYLINARDFDKKRGVTRSLDEDDRVINELKEKLKSN